MRIAASTVVAPRVSDFLLRTEKDHGVPGLINLFGIEVAGADGEPSFLRTGWRTASDRTEDKAHTGAASLAGWT